MRLRPLSLNASRYYIRGLSFSGGRIRSFSVLCCKRGVGIRVGRMSLGGVERSRWNGLYEGRGTLGLAVGLEEGS